MTVFRCMLAAAIASCYVPNSSPVTLLRAHDNAVYDPLLGSPVDALNATLQTVDRVFFPKDFALDKPFTMSLRAGESVLMPFSSAFPSMSSDPKSFAIGFEFSVCEGKVLSSIVTTDDRQQQFSSAQYQCATVTKAHDTQWFNLCPVLNDPTAVALRQDQTKIKGILLLAEVKHQAEVVVVLRSTTHGGAYKKSFFVPDPAASLPQVNISYSIESTQLAFQSVTTWEPTDATPTIRHCDGCEYVMYAELAPPSNDSVSHDTRLPPLQCFARTVAVKYNLPAASGADDAIHHIAVSDSFADQFSISGDYRFILVASLPLSSNNGHTALLAYAPTRIKVTAPTHYISHFLVALGVVGILVFLVVVAVKSELPTLLWQVRTAPEPAGQDDESVRLLAQAIADQEAEENAADLDPRADDAESAPPTSLLDAIRKTQAKTATPQPSPRSVPIQLDGYQEIN